MARIAIGLAAFVALTASVAPEGRPSIEREKGRGSLFLIGDARLSRSMDRWLQTSVWATLEGTVQLS